MVNVSLSEPTVLPSDAVTINSSDNTVSPSERALTVEFVLSIT